MESQPENISSRDCTPLAQPTAKKNNFFPRSYPFPIIDASDEKKDYKIMIGHIKDQCVEVTDEASIRILFTQGFYGKGTLSRSTPQVLEKKLVLESKGHKKHGNVGQNFSKNSSNNMNKDSTQEVVDVDGNPSKRSKTEEIEVVLSDEESEMPDVEAVKEPLAGPTEKEVLQLSFEEAYFLSYGLGCLIVKNKDIPLDLMRLWQTCCELHPSQNFPVMYTAYHHFRSKGWIVRNGLKYGTDFILYKDGPPFYHSSYAVVVKPVKEKHLRDVAGPGRRPPLTWGALAALCRTCGHTAKALMVLYVIKPETISENKISTPFCISQYKLDEVVVQRFVPAENRDET